MKKSRWIFLIVINVVLCLCLALVTGCGKKEEDTPPQEVVDEPEQPANNDEPAYDIEVETPDEIVEMWHVDNLDDFPENYDEMTEEEKLAEQKNHVMAYLSRHATEPNRYVLNIVGSGDMINYTYDTADDGYEYSPWFRQYGSYILEINIDKNVTSIGAYAFYSCSNVENIMISSAITSIGNYAFCKCTSLKSINMPNNIQSLGMGVFDSCSSLEKITVPKGITTISDDLFISCSKISQITILGDITSIGKRSFKSCVSMTVFNIPSTVESVGEYAFTEDTAIIYVENENLEIDKISLGRCRVIYLGLNNAPKNYNDTFEYVLTSSGCIVTRALETNVKEVVIPAKIEEKNVTEVAEYAFKNNSTITKVTFDQNSIVSNIYDETFYSCSNLKEVYLPKSITSIGDYAFKKCIALQTINLNELTNLTEIGEAAFYECESLLEIYIPDSVTKTGKHIFYNCESAQSITIGNSLTSIGNNSFEYCSSVKTLTFNSNSKMKTIAQSAFRYCSNLQSVNLPDSVEELGSLAFGNCSSLESIALSKNIKSDFNRWFENSPSISSITIGEENTIYSAEEGVLYNKDKTKIIYFAGNTGRSSFTIPTTITEVGRNAFIDTHMAIYVKHTFADEAANKSTWYNSNAYYYLGNYQDVIKYGELFECLYQFNDVVDNEVQSVYSYGDLNKSNIIVTAGLSAENIIIPESIGGRNITEIADFAFYKSSTIKSLVTYSTLKVFGLWTFCQCENLESVVISDSVVDLGQRTFQYCSSLNTVYMGSGITQVKDGTFTGCQQLSTVYINTQDLLESIQKLADAGNLIRYSQTVYVLASLDLTNDVENLTARSFLTTERYSRSDTLTTYALKTGEAPEDVSNKDYYMITKS